MLPSLYIAMPTVSRRVEYAWDPDSSSDPLVPKHYTHSPANFIFSWSIIARALSLIAHAMLLLLMTANQTRLIRVRQATFGKPRLWWPSPRNQSHVLDVERISHEYTAWKST